MQSVLVRACPAPISSRCFESSNTAPTRMFKSRRMPCQGLILHTTYRLGEGGRTPLYQPVFCHDPRFS